MSDKRQEPTQRTPKGLEIPVPKREDVMDAFRKIARAPTQQHPAAHSYDWVQARRTEWENLSQEFGRDSGEAKKARKRYLRALKHYSEQTYVLPPRGD